MLENRQDFVRLEQHRHGIAQGASNADRTPDLGPRPHGLAQLQPKIVALKRGEYLYREGRPADVVFQIQQGVALSYQLSLSGRRRVFAIHNSGDFIGFNLATTAGTSCRAVMPGAVAVFRRSELLTRINGDLALASEISSHLLRDLQWTDEHIIALGLPALERVSRYLLRTEARQHRTGPVDLLVSRRDVADYLGLTIETVCRVITQLKKSGAIRLETPNLITVANRMKLKAAAGFD